VRRQVRPEDVAKRRRRVKSYLLTTGTIFGLVVLAHVWRVIEEGVRLARDPWFVALTALSAGLCLWAFRLLRS
jgi:hypothetical protein